MDDDGPVIGAGALPSAGAGLRDEQALAAREAEVFLVPSWTAGAAPTAAAGKGRRSGKLVREIIETALLVLLVFLAVRASLQNYMVEGYSMLPNLDHGQHVLVNKLAYAEINLDRLTDFIPFVDAGDGAVWEVFGGPQRGDIVVLESPSGIGNDLIKRVIGLPGDRIDIVEGRVYINGRLLDEPYIRDVWGGTHGAVAVPDRHYYVLGDNRDSSQDSRTLFVGMVPRELIVGKALIRYWPLGDFGLPANGGAELTETTLAGRAESGP